MNKKSDFIIPDLKDKRKKSHKKRTAIIAGALSVVCVATMAGVYHLETKKTAEEKVLVNWEDNVTSDTSEKVKVNLGSDETKEPTATISAGVSDNETASNDVQTNTSLLEQDLSEAGFATEASDEETVGKDAVELEDDSTSVSAKNSIAVQFSADDTLSWPVTGNIILDYSMDATTYFPTLDQYKYNPALIIQSEVGTKVYCAAAGIVESIEESEETGLTVTMDIGGGYELVYGQLSGINYSTGTYIEEGAVVGQVAEPTKYYSVEGTNLYFEMLNNSVPTNPVDFLKNGVIDD